ncbi:hypothetical protein HJC23_012224 [Cyclotella cryptica]|uniref:NADH:flavin oxidoreductase/NADH oxidase N-terminal domain-containing protein n=1 Tax=Cyclotella cryptica TaxID=29204 RepID=A0ABD3P340_9STRA|eukprot:CCRYP_017711-RA/>CCRYP_017711-RA protein AED:0.07 eAED:0.05 QI:0/-1/0/1/-1/1/1/0/248
MKQHANAWTTVVDCIHGKKGIIYLQLWHMGHLAHSSHHPSTYQIVLASAIAAEGIQVKTIKQENAKPKVPHILTVEEIKSTVQGCVDEAPLEKEAGFYAIEVGHCFLMISTLQFHIHQTLKSKVFIPSASHICSFRLPMDISLTSSCKASLTSTRMSMVAALKNERASYFETFAYVAKKMHEYELAFLHIMDGLGIGAHNKGKYVKCANIHKVFDGPIISNICLSKEIAKGMIRSGACDAFAFGRLYI